MVNGQLSTVEQITNAEAAAGLLELLLPDARTVLDMTYGKGRFWSARHPVRVTVTGLDLDPARAPDVVGDFRSLGFADGSFDVCSFDPAYQWDTGQRKSSIVGGRFGTYRSADEARSSIEAGSREAWRVARLGVIVKV